MHRTEPTPRLWVFGLLVLVALSAVMFMGVPSAGAQDEEVVLRGTLRAAREPVAGVDLTVTDADGTVVGEATSGEDGKWEVPFTELGEYFVTLDPLTLPEGIGFNLEEGAVYEDGVTNIISRTVEDLKNTSIAFKLVDGAAPIVEPDPEWQRYLNRAVSGLRVGLLVALASVGLSLIYGVTGLVNFAHSEMVTFGAVVAFGFEALWPSLPFVFVVALGVIAGGILGYVLERGMFRPLRARKMNNISLMVVSIGLAFVMRYVIVILFGADKTAYKHYLTQSAVDFGPISLPPKDWFLMGGALVMLLAVGLLLQRTKLGTAMRAVADNPPLAKSSGIDVDKTILAVWIVGSALAACGGIFLGLTQRVEWQMGEAMLLLIFAAVTLGGLGTAYGAITGGLVIGMASEMSTLWLDADLKFLVALVALIAVLLIRPQGILGVRERFG